MSFILTHHAQERLRLRHITATDIERVLSRPDRTIPGKKPHTTVFIRTLNQRRLHVIASYLVEEKQWLVVSVWVRGEQDPLPLIWKLITFPFWVGWWGVRRLLGWK